MTTIRYAEDLAACRTSHPSRLALVLHGLAPAAEPHRRAGDGALRVLPRRRRPDRRGGERRRARSRRERHARGRGAACPARPDLRRTPPVTAAEDRALAEVVERFGIPRSMPEALLEGLAWDASGREYHTLSELYDYAARVAGCVGAMMTLVMGTSDARAVARACDLGVAMQLTNIARDVGEDARMGPALPAARLVRRARPRRRRLARRPDGRRARAPHDEATSRLRRHPLPARRDRHRAPPPRLPPPASAPRA